MGTRLAAAALVLAVLARPAFAQEPRLSPAPDPPEADTARAVATNQAKPGVLPVLAAVATPAAAAARRTGGKKTVARR